MSHSSSSSSFEPGVASRPVDISYRRVLRIATPVLVSQLSYTAMGVVDTMMVGRLGISELGGVGLGNMITWWFLSFFYGVLSVVNTYVAQNLGANRRKGVGVTLWHGLYLGLVFAAMITASAFIAPMAFRLAGADAELTRFASEYAFIRLLGGFGLALFLVSDNFYRGLGRTDVPMWAAWCQVLMNCGLNYLLIFGKFGAPQLGVEGAALGTVIAQSVVGVGLLVSIFGRGVYRRRYLLARTWRLDPPVVRTMIAVGLPIGVQFFMEMGGISLFSALIARLGPAQMAATNAVIQAWSVTFMAAAALAVTNTTLVGQCLGARRVEDARSAVRKVMNLGTGLTIVGGIFYFGFPEALMRLFVEGQDVAELLPYAKPLFGIVVVCLFFDLRFNLLSGALRGAGDTTYSMVVNVSSVWFVFVPATILLLSRYELVGAWWALAIHVALMAAMLEWRYRGSRWIEVFLRREERQAEERERRRGRLQSNPSS